MSFRAKNCLNVMPAVRGYYFDDTKEMIYAKNVLEAISRRFSKNVYTGAQIERMEFKPLNQENIEAVFWQTGEECPVSVFLEDTCSSSSTRSAGERVSLLGQPHCMSSYYLDFVIDTISHSDKSCSEILWEEHHQLVMCSPAQARYLAQTINTMCSEQDAIEGVTELRMITEDKSW
jgi:hypothetical protein